MKNLTFIHIKFIMKTIMQLSIVITDEIIIKGDVNEEKDKNIYNNGNSAFGCNNINNRIYRL